MFAKPKEAFGTAPKLIAWKIEPAAGGDDCYRVMLTTEHDKANIALRHAYADYSLSRGLLDCNMTPEPPESAKGDDKSLSAVMIAFNVLTSAFRDISNVIDTYKMLAFSVKTCCEDAEKLSSESTPKQMAVMARKSMDASQGVEMAGVGFSCVEKDGFFVLVIGNESAMRTNDEERIFAVIYAPGGAVRHVTLPRCADAYGEGEYQFCYTAAHIVADSVLPDERPATLDAFKASADKFLGRFTEQVNGGGIDLETLYGGCVASHPENPPDCPAMQAPEKPELRLYITLVMSALSNEYIVFFTPQEVSADIRENEPDTYLAMQLTRDKGVQVDDHKGQDWIASTPAVVDTFVFLGRALDSLGRYPENYQEFSDIVSATMQNYRSRDGSLPTVTVHEPKTI